VTSETVFSVFYLSVTKCHFRNFEIVQASNSLSIFGAI